MTRPGRTRAGAPDLRRLAAALALGIPAQAVIGGLTVLFDLNPYLVGLHLLLSMVLISLAVWLVRLTRALLVPAGVAAVAGSGPPPFLPCGRRRPRHRAHRQRPARRR